MFHNLVCLSNKPNCIFYSKPDSKANKTISLVKEILESKQASSVYSRKNFIQ